MINKNVININSYRRIRPMVKNNTDQSLKLKRNFSQYTMEEVSLDESYEDTFNDRVFNEFTPFECLVSFIIDYGMKVNENESEQYRRFMLNYHCCVEFYGIKYYIPNNTFNHKEIAIYNYLISNYKSHYNNNH